MGESLANHESGLLRGWGLSRCEEMGRIREGLGAGHEVAGPPGPPSVACRVGGRWCPRVLAPGNPRRLGRTLRGCPKVQNRGCHRGWLSTDVAGDAVLKLRSGSLSHLPSAQAQTPGGSAQQHSVSHPSPRRTESSWRDEPRSQVRGEHTWPQGPLPGPQSRLRAPHPAVMGPRMDGWTDGPSTPLPCPQLGPLASRLRVLICELACGRTTSQLSEGDHRSAFKSLYQQRKDFPEGEARKVGTHGNSSVSGLRPSGTGKTTSQAQGRAHGHPVLPAGEPAYRLGSGPLETVWPLPGGCG